MKQGRKCHTGFLVAGIVLILAVNFWLFPSFSHWFGFSKPIRPLDLHFGFDRDTAYRFLTQAGEKGRQIYRLSILFIDMPYAVFYALYYRYIFRCLDSRRKSFCYFPLLIGLFDIAENILFIRLIVSYPDLNRTTVRLASFFNSAKWIFALLTFLIFTGLLIRHFNTTEKIKHND